MDISASACSWGSAERCGRGARSRAERGTSEGESRHSRKLVSQRKAEVGVKCGLPISDRADLREYRSDLVDASMDRKSVTKAKGKREIVVADGAITPLTCQAAAILSDKCFDIEGPRIRLMLLLTA